MNRSAAAGAAVAALALIATATAFQETPDGDVLEELRRLRERVETLEERHQGDEERIRRLEAELARSRPQPPAERPSPTVPPLEESLLPDSAAQLTYPAAGAASGQGNLLNPSITAFFDMGFSLSSDDAPGFNRFNLRETELDIRAAVTPWADGVLILAFPEEIETTETGETEIDIVFEVEEAYLDLHTFAAGLALKGGKFRNAFGTSNLLHTHDLPQVDRPLANVAFFGLEGLSTIGASASWIVPNPWDTYIEIIGEVVNADGGEEAPILGGPDADNPAFLGHLRWFDDFGLYGSYELGGSYLYARTSEDHSFDANVFGANAHVKWLDPAAPDLQSLLFQTEAYWAANDLEDGPSGPFRNESLGFYAFGQYQFAQNWYTGIRFDYTEFPDIEERLPGDADWAVSPYLTWYVTEFLRLRLEYQHLESEISGDWDGRENVLFAITFSIGSHPPHPYWVNR